MTPFPEKMPFHGSNPTPSSVFVCFVCFVVQSLLAPSWFCFFPCFRVFRGFENIIRAHSCPLVVLRFFRAPSWFCFFPCVSCVSWFNPPCPFVVLILLFVPIRVHPWFCFRVFRVFRGSTPLAPGHDYDDYLSVCLKNADGAASWGGRSGEYSPLPSAPSTLHP